MTTKQRNFWLAALALAAIVYFAPTIIHSFRQARVTAPPAPSSSRRTTKSPCPLPLPRHSRTSWASGRAPRRCPSECAVSNSSCARRRRSGPFLRIPGALLRPRDGDPSRTNGAYGTTGDIVQTQPAIGDAHRLRRKRLDPVQRGQGHRKTVSGCALTSFTVTPFGEDQVIAEWQEGNCPEAPQGGQILLRKTGK